MSIARKASILAFTALAILPLSCMAQFPTNTNTKTIDALKPSADFNDFNFRWRGTEDQCMYFTVTNLSLSQCVAVFKASRKVAGGSNTCYVLEYGVVSATNKTIRYFVSHTNVPPDGTYQAEIRISNAATNLFRTLAQGKVSVTDSLFDDSDGSWAGRTGLNLSDYLTKVEAATIYGVNGGDVSAVLAGTGIDVAESQGPEPRIDLNAASQASLALADAAPAALSSATGSLWTASVAAFEPTGAVSRTEQTVGAATGALWLASIAAFEPTGAVARTAATVGNATGALWVATMSAIGVVTQGMLTAEADTAALQALATSTGNLWQASVAAFDPTGATTRAAIRLYDTNAFDVAGAGTAAVNGNYSIAAPVFGTPAWTNANACTFGLFGQAQWRFYPSGESAWLTPLYSLMSASPFGTYTTNNGTNPPPTVTYHALTTTGPAAITGGIFANGVLVGVTP
jgi:hypothetical protein